MNRRSFLFKSGALAFATGALTTALISCAEDDPTGNNPGGNGTKLTANLSSELSGIGSSKAQNNVIVVRTAEGNTISSFVALTSICTHMGCTVGYQSSTQKFVCPCHGSQFNLNGSVANGPASSPLAKYTVRIENDILTVS